MLQAQIEEDRPFPTARSNAYWHRDTGDDLKARAEVDRAADSRRKDEGLSPVALSPLEHFFRAVPREFQHEIQSRPSQPDEALADIEAAGRGSITGGVLGQMRVRSARVEMRDHESRHRDTHREIGLKARRAGTPSLVDRSSR